MLRFFARLLYAIKFVAAISAYSLRHRGARSPTRKSPLSGAR
jgi:hypothetical protein